MLEKEKQSGRRKETKAQEDKNDSQADIDK